MQLFYPCQLILCILQTLSFSIHVCIYRFVYFSFSAVSPLLCNNSSSFTLPTFFTIPSLTSFCRSPHFLYFSTLYFPVTHYHCIPSPLLLQPLLIRYSLPLHPFSLLHLPPLSLLHLPPLALLHLHPLASFHLLSLLLLICYIPYFPSTHLLFLKKVTTKGWTHI